MFKTYIKKPARRRALKLTILTILVGGAMAYALWLFSENMMFYLSPADVSKNPPAPGERFRLGGLVKKGSLSLDKHQTWAFYIIDFEDEVPVRYKGTFPGLFAEGKGAVLEGHLTSDKTFKANQIFAKHDETYRPPTQKAPDG